MYPLSRYLQLHSLEGDRFSGGDVDSGCMSKDDTFLGQVYPTQYFSDDASHNAVWANSLSKMNYERLLPQGLINLSSSLSSPPRTSDSRKRKVEMIEANGASKKDKHSKVCTARGPRDRRVRLSPKTAIQFYDVQDRLGYDRPSKAIDWLIKEAKIAIDALDAQQQPPMDQFKIVSECGMIGKQEDLDYENHVSTFELFIDNSSNPAGNISKTGLEEAILNPGYQQGLISGLATSSQILDTTWEVARLQRLLTVDDDARVEGPEIEYSSLNPPPPRFFSGNSQAFCQSGIINCSPLGISFPGFNLSDELSNVATAAALLQEGAKEKTDLNKKSSFLQYQGGISG
ncbi:uncharacterized protein LOC127254234 isoform X2 [Andrographis paniculata]|uniref:uncharacterized protein LOC127254234 isoform X2 n=1 Tax=Andrographis paniculata TaxID=175694 RepID=UPI0021E809DD|nr:uncharacterized protein LOC127254234 isoform X2 [Andrographis paniculata]